MIKDNKYEYFSNGIWHECTNKEYDERLDNDLELLNRVTIITTIYKYIYYHRGRHSFHRMDGPAVQNYIENNLDYESWYVNGKRVHLFETYYCDTEALVENLFRYVTDYPYFLNQTILLSEYNKWLTEDQILLLKNIQLFGNLK